MVIMFFADGFEQTEAICPLDMLRRAGADVKTVSITDKYEVTSSGGLTIRTDMKISELGDETPEMTILPGGQPGTDNLFGCDKVKEIVRKTYDEDKFVAAICAAPYVLGKMGILRGKEAICYPGYESELEGAVISGKRTVRSGNVITAAGMGVSLDFGAELVSALYGREKADAVLKSIMAI